MKLPGVTLKDALFLILVLGVLCTSLSLLSIGSRSNLNSEPKVLKALMAGGHVQKPIKRDDSVFFIFRLSAESESSQTLFIPRNFPSQILLIESDACSHWSLGMKDESFCATQDILKIILSHQERGLSLPKYVVSISVSDISATRSTIAKVVEKLAVGMPLKMIDVFPEYEAMVVATEFIEELKSGLCKIYQNSFSLANTTTLFESRELTRLLKDESTVEVSNRLKDLSHVEYEKFSVPKYFRDLFAVNKRQFSESLRANGLGQVEYRIHYSRNQCVKESRYNYPSLVFPEIECSLDGSTLKTALLFVFTSQGRKSKFEKSITLMIDKLPKFIKMLEGTNIEVLLGTIPLKDFDSEKRQVFESALNEISIIKHIEFQYFTRASDFHPSFLDYIRSRSNCCQESEFEKLSAWTLTEYDAVLVLDFDIKFRDINVVRKLLACSRKFDFLSTIDPKVALQGGMYLVKPSQERFEDMRKLLGKAHLYDKYTGYSKSGPFFSPLHAETLRRKEGRPAQSFAMETPQGLLFYYFYVLENDLNVAQIEVCSHNLRKNIYLNSELARELLVFECPQSVGKYCGDYVLSDSLHGNAPSKAFLQISCEWMGFKGYNDSRFSLHLV